MNIIEQTVSRNLKLHRYIVHKFSDKLLSENLTSLMPGEEEDQVQCSLLHTVKNPR